MTTWQIIQEIKGLTRPDQEEVFHALESVLQTGKPDVLFASKEQVEKASKVVFAKRDQLFRRLAQ